MSLNHILESSPANANLDVEFKSVKCETIITPYSDRLTLANVPILNTGNGENLGLVNINIQKNNNIVNCYISGFNSSVLTVGGNIEIGYTFPSQYDSLDGGIFSYLIPKSRNADLPMFKPEAFVIWDNVNKRLYIKNTGNGTNFPNGENVIVNAMNIQWFTAV